MPFGRFSAQLLPGILLVCLLASVVGFAARPEERNKTVSPEAKLYWALDQFLAQGEAEKAKQFVQANGEVTRRLVANLLFAQLELTFELEDATPLSPRMSEILALLNSVVDEPLKRLMTLVNEVKKGLNPFRNESDELAKALADFIDAAKGDDPDEQIEKWQSALQKCDALGLELGKLICLHNLARIERDKGSLAPAFAHFSQVYELLNRWNYVARMAAVLNAFGITSYRLGLLETAQRQLSMALELAKRQGDERLQGMILTNLSAVAIQLGNFRQAAELLQQALECGRTATRLLNLGTIHTYLRDYENALLAFQEALELAKKSNDLSRQILTWNNIGGVYWLQGNYEQALRFLQQALTVAQKTQDIYRTAPVHLTLGLIYTDLGEFENAEKHLNELLQVSRQLGDQVSEVGTLIRLGHLKNRQKQWDEAVGFLEEAVRAATKLNHQPSIALALLTLGVSYEGKKQFDKALEAYQEALLIWQSMNVDWVLAWTWNNIGDAYRRRGMEQIKAQKENDLQRAIDAYWQSVRLMEKVREGAGREVMGAQFAQNASYPFYQLSDLLAQMGRVEEAFEITERMRARALIELIQTAGILEQGSGLEQVAVEGDALKRRIAELEDQITRLLASPSPNWNQIEHLQRELESVQSEFERQRDILRLQRWKLLPINRQQIAFNAWKQINLPEDTAVLAYIVTEQRTWLFVISRNKGNWQVQCLKLSVTLKQLEEDIGWLRERIEGKRPVGATLQRLYAALVAPAEGALKGKRRLIIVPDGPLFALPFQVLQDDEGVYLLERFTITYAPSLTTLWALQKRALSVASLRVDDNGSNDRRGQAPTLPKLRELSPPAGSNNLSENLSVRNLLKWQWVGLAVKDFGSGLEPLPYAREEVRWISSLLTHIRAKLPIRILVDANATKQSALQALKESRWVHFATHAVLEPRRPLYSRLILAGSKNQDNALRAFEVLDLGQISCEMVVLSACETGLGKALQSEGLMGLVWTFMAAGTKTLVVSQWKVNDLSTAHLMRSYYEFLLKGLRPAEALQRAQMSLLSQQKFHHPYYWAAFVVWGNQF